MSLIRGVVDVFANMTRAAQAERECHLIAEAQRRFAGCDQMYADQKERDERLWLTVWAGKQWGDQAPNRLFGAWLNERGEAV